MVLDSVDLNYTKKSCANHSHDLLFIIEILKVLTFTFFQFKILKASYTV